MIGRALLASIALAAMASGVNAEAAREVEAPAKIGDWNATRLRGFNTSEPSTAYATRARPDARVLFSIGCQEAGPLIGFDFGTYIASPMVHVQFDGAEAVAFTANRRGDMAQIGEIATAWRLIKGLGDGRRTRIEIGRSYDDNIVTTLPINGLPTVIGTLAKACGWPK